MEKLKLDQITKSRPEPRHIPEVPKYNKPLVGRMKFYYKNPIVDAYFSYLLALIALLL